MACRCMIKTDGNCCYVFNFINARGSSPPGKRAKLKKKKKKKHYWDTAPLLSATRGQVGIETLSTGIKSQLMGFLL